MISFEGFKTSGSAPIYMQITAFIKRGIAAETIADGDELPSRRYLAALLGINPNTVQKAFVMLEEEGLIESRAGAKSVICLVEGSVEDVRSQLLDQEIASVISSLKQMGMAKYQALALIEKNWREDQNE